MSMPPYMLYALRCDPDAVLARLQEMVPHIEVTKDGEVWKEARAVWKRGWLKKPLCIKVTHKPEYYGDRASFATQMAGLANYLRKFPGAEEKPEVFACIRSVQFALSIELVPAAEDTDPRLEVLAAIAETTNGFFFLPYALLDNCGRIILSLDGENDARAIVPSPPGGSVTEEDAEEEPGGEMELRPPPADRAARRLQVLIATSVRGFAENTQADTSEKEAFVQGLLEVLHETGAWEEAEPHERAGLEAPIGGLSQQQIGTFTWKCEAAAMLAWALGLKEPAPYDQMVQAWDILYCAGLGVRENRPSPTGIVANAVLRSHEELKLMERRIFALHWRLREFSLRPTPMDFRSFAETAWFGPLDISLAVLAGDDLAIQGKPLSECGDQEWRPVAGILQERHQAINWLLGYSQVYSETDTGT